MSATSPRSEELRHSPVLAFRRALRRSKRWLGRLPVGAVWLLLGLLLGVVAAREARTSALQAQLLTALNERLHFALAPGPSDGLVVPRHGPYDRRLGYVRIPEWTARLAHEGFVVREQAQWSKPLLRVARLGITPPYDEKTQAGLSVRGRDGERVFQVSEPARGYSDFDAIPPLVRDTLLFVENRELLHEEPRRNPAIEWDRFARAVLTQLTGHEDGRGPGGSTLATQMEKYRHSPGGLTSDPFEKLRQIASASVRAYRHGEDTRAVRRRILLDYLNSLPLAATAARGEVLGLAAGLEAWYGADFERTNQLLAAAPDARDAAGLAEQGVAYREVLSLLLATRRPSTYLRERPEALDALAESHLRLLAEAGVIPAALRDAAASAHPRRGTPGAPTSGPAGPAEPVRRWLIGALALPDYYALDRVDLSVTSTLDADLQQQVERRLASLADPAVVAASGLRAKGLLEDADPARVIYSFALYERVGETNRLRVMADNYDGALDVNEGVKLDLGSTAKLRTLATYLEAIATIHARLAGAAPEALREVAAAETADPLTRFVAETLVAEPEAGLDHMLDEALERRYSASPWPGFYTGGGLHYFHNFNKEDATRILSVRSAFRDSVNLPFVRLMRDLVAYEIAQLPGDPSAMLRDRADPRRAIWLRRVQEEESRTFLARFHRRLAAKSPDEALAAWVARAHPTPKRFSVTYRSLFPERPFEDFAAALHTLPAATKLAESDLRALYGKYARDRFSLADRAFLARMHPLELWLMEWLRAHPGAGLDEAWAASGEARDVAYAWLFQTRNRGAQDRRLRTLLEREAFGRIHRDWKRLGYPFGSLAPSYATAIGSSGDRPSSLAELIGIIAADGVKLPTVRVSELRFAADTPYETALAPAAERAERVLRPEVAHALRGALLDVVANGTARRAAGAFAEPLGGKTGTGDHQKKRVDRWANVIDSEYVSRSATFVFFAGDRFHGVVTAHVEGPESAAYRFTSSLPVQVLKDLAPLLEPVFAATPEDGTTVARNVPASPPQMRRSRPAQ